MQNWEDGRVKKRAGAVLVGVGDLECAGVEREERERKKGRQAWDINRPRENKRRFHMV